MDGEAPYMTGETLYGETDYFKPFPDPQDVFASKIDEHSKYLLPLASIHLSRIRPELKGVAHFVLPIEPYQGCIGERNEKYHSYLCRMNWVGYRVINDRYELAGDFRFFIKGLYDLDLGEHERPWATRVKLDDHYEQTRHAYERRKEYYRRHGCLHSCSSNNQVALARFVGGVSGNGNWPSIGKFPVAYGDNSTAVPLTEDGRPFIFVGEAPVFGWHYVTLPSGVEDGGLPGDTMLLFYDPKERIALTTFDWA